MTKSTVRNQESVILVVILVIEKVIWQFIDTLVNDKFITITITDLKM